MNKNFKPIQYRSCWMGFAILWIVAFHSKFGMPVEFLSFIKKIGYGGTDIFLFASGLGCYYSLSKNSEPAAFLRRRFHKMAPAYWIILTVWILYEKLFFDISPVQLFGNYAFIQLFISEELSYNWYLTAIWVMYFLAPFLFHSVCQKSFKRKLFILIFLIVVSLFFRNTLNLLRITARIPVFYLGMIYADFFKGRKVDCRCILLINLFMVIGLVFLCVGYYVLSSLWVPPLYWFPFLLIAPGICTDLSLICFYSEESKIGRHVINCLNTIGEYSYEVYLTHIFIYERILNTLFESYPSQRLIWIIGTVLIIPSTILLKKVSQKLSFIFYNSKTAQE